MAKHPEEREKGLPPQEAAVGEESAAPGPRRTTGDAGTEALPAAVAAAGGRAAMRAPGAGDHRSYRPAAGAQGSEGACECAAPAAAKLPACEAGERLEAEQKRARIPGESA